jgi:hypothetical protein
MRAPLLQRLVLDILKHCIALQVLNINQNMFDEYKKRGIILAFFEYSLNTRTDMEWMTELTDDQHSLFHVSWSSAGMHRRIVNGVDSGLHLQLSVGAVNDALLHILYVHCPTSLRTIELTHVWITTGGLNSMLQQCTSLETLIIGSFVPLTDDTLCVIATHNHALRELVINRGQQRISSRAIHHLLNCNSQLTIRLNDCALNGGYVSHDRVIYTYKGRIMRDFETNVAFTCAALARVVMGFPRFCIEFVLVWFFYVLDWIFFVITLGQF